MCTIMLFCTSRQFYHHKLNRNQPEGWTTGKKRRVHNRNAISKKTITVMDKLIVSNALTLTVVWFERTGLYCMSPCKRSCISIRRSECEPAAAAVTSPAGTVRPKPNLSLSHLSSVTPPPPSRSPAWPLVYDTDTWQPGAGRIAGMSLGGFDRDFPPTLDPHVQLSHEAAGSVEGRRGNEWAKSSLFQRLN